MATLFVMRCDMADCASEAPLEIPWSEVTHASSGGQIRIPPTVQPNGWRQADGHDFCSWACLAQYANAMGGD
jgi:hypothetical protein